MSGDMYGQTLYDDDTEPGGLDILPDARTGRPAQRARCKSPELGLLVQAVQTEVIPRLLSVHKNEPRAGRLPTLGDVEQLAGHVLDSDGAAARRLIDTLRADGVGIEAVYLNLLGATARMLGEMWEQDRINFIDVTVGLCTLHQILFRLAPDSGDDGPESGRRALFVPVPGETHVFGSLLVARFFSRAGWRTWTEISADDALLTDLLRHNVFDLVGLSISCDRHIDTLRETIARLRALEPALTIMIGGHAVERNPDLAAEVGADSCASDPHSAVAMAESLIDKARARV